MTEFEKKMIAIEEKKLLILADIKLALDDIANNLWRSE